MNWLSDELSGMVRCLIFKMSCAVCFPSLSRLRICANSLLCPCLMISTSSNILKSSCQRFGAREPYSMSSKSENMTIHDRFELKQISNSNNANTTKVLFASFYVF